MPNKLPIIAHGEAYVAPVERPTGGGPKERPHEYREAKARLLSDLHTVAEKVAEDPDLYLDEKVVCVRLEPKFEAKSYVPTTLIHSSDDIALVGGRRYKIKESEPTDGNVDKNGKADEHKPESAKLYFLRATDKGLTDLEAVLHSGANDAIESWRNEITSIRSFDLLAPDEKALGFDTEWESGRIEAVLHPFGKEEDAAVDMFCATTGLRRQDVEVRPYEGGVTFIAATLTREAAMRAARINPLRTIHPLGRVVFEPMRSTIEAEAPQVRKTTVVPEVTIGVFDAGCNPDVPLLKGHVDAFDCVASGVAKDGVEHGTAVCGAVLYGELSGKTAKDTMPAPEVKVDAFRVLPPSDPHDFDLYESIDAIEHVVTTHPDIGVYNLSFGPTGPILDDDISRFTYALDILSSPNGDAEPPLFCIAVGNDGAQPSPFDRIQSPGDIVNGLGIGAFSYGNGGKAYRTPYSCVGPGREGAKTKPDFLEFGGDLTRPFIAVGAEGNKLVMTAGTSFSSPFATHKVGSMLAESIDVSPHLARTLMLHNAQLSDGVSKQEYGFGIAPRDVTSCLGCEDNRVTTLYQGFLRPRQQVSLPIFAPSIEDAAGTVKITWTIVAVCKIDPNDSDAYTASCISDTFVPHANKYNFHKGTSTRVVDLSTVEGRAKADEYEAEGYQASAMPASRPAKRYWDEAELRARDFKWDTTIKKTDSLRASSLHNPALVLQSIFRDNSDPEALTRYYVAVTVEAAGYEGSLYNETLQRYPNLQPIRLRLEPRVEAQS